MDMKTDDESGQDNGDDDNLFHLSPEHTRHTQRSMNEKPTIMSLRFCKYDGFSGLEITLYRILRATVLPLCTVPYKKELPFSTDFII
ncbi:hypothetical protein RirG_240950 [Rhizophagus irregularis DAOM 197198w]|uniref:Uncharacterized protein n=2 Tax=Rhizophagus irregularis TaxID=588596 RepID=A0A015K2X1_RHIIW|nr:hypothetical protein RirG_240950 [Rhizophagus irregularis DAOM 197198w]